MKPKRRLLSLRRVVLILVTLLIAEYLVFPQLAGAGKSLSLLRQINLGYLALGIALEAASLVAYAQLTRSVLPRESAPRLLKVLRVNLSTLAVSHVVPGGTMGGSALSYRLLTRFGVSGADAGFALAIQGIGSAVVLNVLLWLSLTISIPLRGFNPLYITAAIVGSMLIGGFLGLVVLLTRGEQRAAALVSTIARRLPFLDEQSAHRAVHRLADQLRLLLANRPLMGRAVGWASANWLLDAASLGVFLAAFGHRVSPDGLLIAFCLANVLAAVPVTPGGLGIVEAVLTPTLVGFGTPKAIAILGVISYRFFNFWMPIPAGGIAYLSLRADRSPLKESAKEMLQIGRQNEAMMVDVSNRTVFLRNVIQEDLPVFFSQQLDPEAIRMAAFPARDRDAFTEHWTKIMADPSVTLKTIVSDGEVAGNIVAWESSSKTLVGYWIGRSFWGHGIATRALAAFLEHLKVRPLHAYVAKRNIASIRVLQKCGFSIIGEDDGPPDADGEAVRELIFELRAPSVAFDADTAHPAP